LLTLYHQYVKEVTTGQKVVCKYVRQAVERQVNDLKRQNTPDFQYYFDEDEAARWIGFISILKHTSGEWKGQPFNIQDFQAFRWACIFGWKRTDGRGRRFRRAYVEVARKQGKTEEAATIGLGGLLIDNENTAQIFSAATTRQQAKIVYSAAKIMARELMKDSEGANETLRLLAHRILNKNSDGFFEALSSDAWTLDGLSPHVAIIDEYHAHPTNEVLKVIETGMGARRSPLIYIITTAGFNISSPCFMLRQNAIDILRGQKRDETFFTAIYTLDEGDDWNDESVWVKANPQIGITPTWDFMRSEYTKAVNEGGQSEVEFKTKNLNVWTASSETWIQDEIWQACPKEIDEDSLLGKPCYVGVDFAAISDFTAAAFLFPPHGDRKEYALLLRFWLPQDKIKERARDWPDTIKWWNEGYIKGTPGNVVDLEILEQDFKGLCAKYDVKVVGYDPLNAWQTIANLEQSGLNMDRYPNTRLHMSPASKEFERLVRQKMVNHGGNPVLRWMMTNVVPVYTQQDLLQLDRMRSSRISKIDGVVASVIALGELLKNPVAEVFSDTDLFFL
jgi:phage terminase large subunit-like protein